MVSIDVHGCYERVAKEALCPESRSCGRVKSRDSSDASRLPDPSLNGALYCNLAATASLPHASHFHGRRQSYKKF